MMKPVSPEEKTLLIALLILLLNRFSGLIRRNADLMITLWGKTLDRVADWMRAFGERGVRP